MSDIQAPPLDLDEANYAHCQVVETLPIPADTFFDWYMDETPANFMLGTLIVSPITSVEPLSEQPFGAAGTSRLIHFKDGTIARECVLTADMPKEYSYQPYGFTNPMRFLSDYAKAKMSVVADGENTIITWDYAFHAKSKASLPVVKLFVALDWKRNLANGLKVIKEHLALHGTSKHIHEADESRHAA